MQLLDVIMQILCNHRQIQEGFRSKLLFLSESTFLVHSYFRAGKLPESKGLEKVAKDLLKISDAIPIDL